MASVFDYFQNLFASLFNANPKDAEKRRQLKLLFSQIQQIHPPYFKRGSPQILPGFPTRLLELLKLLKPIFDLVQKTVCNPDSRLAERFRDHLILARLPESRQTLFSQFTYDAMKERLLAAADPEKDLKKLGKEFQDTIGLLEGSAYLSFDQDYHEIEALANLSLHRFQPLFEPFAPSFDPASSEHVPHFSAAGGKKIVQELMDLHFLLGGLSFSPALERSLGLLAERTELEAAKETKQNIKRAFERAAKLFHQFLSPSIILHLVRLLEEDPSFQPRQPKEEESYLEGFKQRLQGAYQRARERIEREKIESSTIQELKALFGDTELLTVEGYDEGVSKELQSRGFEGFKHIRPLSIVKSFTLAKFEREVRDPVKKLLVEGFFENKTFQNTLANSFYACETMLEKMTGFEQHLKSDGQISLKTIRKYLALNDQGKQVTLIINKVVDSIENKARSLMEEQSQLLYALGRNLLDALNDAKQKTPQLISNIKVIAGKGNRDFLFSLVNGYNQINRFLRVMKNFIVLRGAEPA